MKQSQVDYINFRYLLKGNYRKGVHALRSILADGGQAKAFAENPAAVAVVLSYDKENPDKNAEELYELLTSSSVADLAAATYICSTYGVTTFAELYADDEALAQLLEDSSSMNAVAASSAAMEALVADDAAFSQACESEAAMTAIAASSGAMEIVAASATAMNAVIASDTALSAVTSSSVAMDAVTSSSTAMGIASRSATFCLAGINAGYAPALMANATAGATISADASCMKAVAADSSALTAWWDSANFWANAKAASAVIAANNSSFSSLVGKKKSFAVGSYGSFAFVVVAVGHNATSTGTAGMTFQSEKIVTTQQMNSSNTTTGGWASTAMRTFLSGTLLPGLPSEVQSALATTTVSYNTASGSSLSTCSDKLWLASEKEVFGSSSYDSAGTQFAYFADGNSKIKNNGSSASGWWLRSVYSSTYFRSVYSDGTAIYDDASGSHGVAPCFCI